MENFVEVKVRMTPEKRETIKIHVKKQNALSETKPDIWFGFT